MTRTGCTIVLRKLIFQNFLGNCSSSKNGFEEMKNIAEKLSQGVPHVRVDLYETNGKIYFGELTFFYEAGFTLFIPDRWNKVFGKWMEIGKR